MRTANKVGYVMLVPLKDQKLDFKRPLKSLRRKSSRSSKSYLVVQACVKICLYWVLLLHPEDWLRNIKSLSLCLALVLLPLPPKKHLLVQVVVVGGYLYGLSFWNSTILWAWKQVTAFFWFLACTFKNVSAENQEREEVGSEWLHFWDHTEKKILRNP